MIIEIKKLLLVVVALTVISAGCMGNDKRTPLEERPQDKEPKTVAEVLLDKMTLEKKIGQLLTL